MPNGAYGKIHGLVDAGHRGNAEWGLADAERREKTELSRLVHKLAGHRRVIELHFEQLDARTQRLDGGQVS